MNKYLSKKILLLILIGLVAASLFLYLVAANQTLCGVRTNDLMGMLSIGFGLGCVPLMPGTAGALGGILLCLFICRLSVKKQLVAVTLLIIVAIPISEYGEQYFATKDDSHIVIDELLTLPVATIGLPVHQYPLLLASVFITSRIMDWTKPPPARATENFKGGVGIVLDDVVACLWTLLLFGLGWRWYRRSTVKNAD